MHGNYVWCVLSSEHCWFESLWLMIVLGSSREYGRTSRQDVLSLRSFSVNRCCKGHRTFQPAPYCQWRLLQDRGWKEQIANSGGWWVQNKVAGNRQAGQHAGDLVRTTRNNTVPCSVNRQFAAIWYSTSQRSFAATTPALVLGGKKSNGMPICRLPWDLAI